MRKSILICDFCSKEADEGELGWVEYDVEVREMGYPGTKLGSWTCCADCRDAQVDPTSRGFLRRLFGKRWRKRGP